MKKSGYIIRQDWSNKEYEKYLRIAITAKFNKHKRLMHNLISTYPRKINKF